MKMIEVHNCESCDYASTYEQYVNGDCIDTPYCQYDGMELVGHDMETIYKECNLNSLPLSIQSEAEYTAALAIIDGLMDAEPGTTEFQLLETWGILIADYEEKHHQISDPTPEALAEFRRDQGISPWTKFNPEDEATWPERNGSELVHYVALWFEYTGKHKRQNMEVRCPGSKFFPADLYDLVRWTIITPPEAI